MDNSFIYFTTPEVLSKIDIDPRLEESFKRVMKKIQEYFNVNDYVSRRNYKEYLEKHLLKSGDKNFRFYINRIDQKGVNGFYNKFKSEICINENMLLLRPDNLDATLCHEFIHFLVMHELIQGKAEPDIIGGGFINESLTEMLTQQIYPNSNAYDAQVAMQKFVNMVSGNQNNFQKFLEGYIDARYCSSDWENYRHNVNEFQKDFNAKGYINLQEAQTNKNLIEAQRKIISLYLKPTENKSIEQYIDAINKLIDRPIKDSEYINDKVISNMDNIMIKNIGSDNKEINAFLQQKLVELRQKILELKNAKGYEFEIAGRKIQIDSNYNLYGNLRGLNGFLKQWDPQTGIITISYNGEKVELNVNKINFHQKEEAIVQQISQLSNYFSNTSSKDLNMISYATKLNEGLTKIEKFQLPVIGKKSNKIIYIATYNKKIVVLNDVQQLSNIKNVELNKFIGMTSTNQSAAAIYFEKIGQISNGITFSFLSSKQIRSQAISTYASELMSNISVADLKKAIIEYKQSEDFYDATEEEIEEEAIQIVAERQFPSLLPEQARKYFNNVIDTNFKFVVSSKDGKITVSTLHGTKNQTAFVGKSNILFDIEGKGMYNEVILSLFNNESKLNNTDLLTVSEISNHTR